VLPDSFEIEVRVRVSDHDAMLTIDGQESARLSAADTVKIRRGRYAVMLIRSAIRTSRFGVTSCGGVERERCSLN